MSEHIKKVDQILEIFEQYGEMDYIGEDVTQTEHMVQAAMLAEAEGATDEDILGALFHDIGHLVAIHRVTNKMGQFGQIGHEKIGAQFLRELGFSETVCLLVQNHVNAKRYLVGKDKKYFENLSDASKKTLEYQGGPMTQEEILAFEKDSLFEASLKIRSWDDQAKIVGMKIKKVSDYVSTMVKNLELSTNK